VPANLHWTPERGGGIRVLGPKFRRLAGISHCFRFLCRNAGKGSVGRPNFRRVGIEHPVNGQCFLRQLPCFVQPPGLGLQ
jgi:hypothetical protein